MFAALNAMMLDMLAAIARKDYEDRRRRRAQGIVNAKASGAYRGRPEGTDRNAGIRRRAALRHVMDGHSRGDRLQPGDNGQGRQAGRVGLASPAYTAARATLALR
jgi:hypothetical protein